MRSIKRVTTEEIFVPDGLSGEDISLILNGGVQVSASQQDVGADTRDSDDERDLDDAGEDDDGDEEHPE